jgi:hypothetical protein
MNHAIDDRRNIESPGIRNPIITNLPAITNIGTLKE